MNTFLRERTVSLAIMFLEHSETQCIGLSSGQVESVVVSDGEMGWQSGLLHQPCKACMQGIGSHFGIAQLVGIGIVSAKKYKFGSLVGSDLQGLLQAFVAIAAIVLVQVDIS